MTLGSTDLRRIYWVSILLFFCALLTPGCGGGTGGTGVRAFEGVVLNETTGLGLDGITITVLESGDSTVTVDGGRFQVATAEENLSVSFVLQGPNGFSASTEAQNISDTSSVFDVEITVNATTQSAEVTNFQPRVATPTPQPTATQPPAITATALPTPTGPPAPMGTPSPTASATIASSPSPTPYVPERCELDLDEDRTITIVDLQLANNRYQAGNLDFNRDGLTSAADITLFFNMFNEFADTTC